MTIPKQRRLTRSQFICSSHLIIYYHDIHTTSFVRILLCYVRYIASFFQTILNYTTHTIQHLSTIVFLSVTHSERVLFSYLCIYYCVPLQYTFFVMPFLCSSATFTSPIEKNRPLLFFLPLEEQKPKR